MAVAEKVADFVRSFRGGEDTRQAEKMVFFTVSYQEIEMNQTAKQRPPMAGFHHFGATVTDVEG